MEKDIMYFTTNGNNTTEQVESCLKFLQRSALSVKDQNLKDMCIRILSSYDNSPASSSSSTQGQTHHTYFGGLIVHTSEVMELALKMAESQCLNVDRDVIITSILYHDIGKMQEYFHETNTETGKVEFKKTDFGTLVGHLPYGYAAFLEDAKKNHVEHQIILKISHVLLSHHGRMEWRSAVEPLLPEAFVVHCADWISSQGCKNDYVRKD